MTSDGNDDLEAKLYKESGLFHSTRTHALRSQLTMGKAMLLIAVSSTCFALYAFSYRFAPVRGAASASAGMTAVLAWSLAAALPALWVGTVRRSLPNGVLLRFAIGNGFLAILMASMSALLFVVILGTAVVIPSVGWYWMSQMSTGEDRDRVGSTIRGFLSYVVQLALTVLLFIATIPLLEGILR
jgi:hypothetical protein